MVCVGYLRFLVGSLVWVFLGGVGWISTSSLLIRLMKNYTLDTTWTWTFEAESWEEAMEIATRSSLPSADIRQSMLVEQETGREEEL